MIVAESSSSKQMLEMIDESDSENIHQKPEIIQPEVEVMVEEHSSSEEENMPIK